MESFKIAQMIGAQSGVIWNYLNSNGKTTILKLKSEVGCRGTVLHIALGWLLREDKIILSEEQGQWMVQLK